jgi:acyl carrier protein
VSNEQSMKTSAAQDRLYETIGGVLGVPSGALDASTSPETISTWDSLNHLILVTALEAEFGIALTPENVLDMRTVGVIEAILRTHGVDV